MKALSKKKWNSKKGRTYQQDFVKKILESKKQAMTGIVSSVNIEKLWS